MSLATITVYNPDVHGTDVLEEYPSKTSEFDLKKLSNNAREFSP